MRKLKPKIMHKLKPIIVPLHLKKNSCMCVKKGKNKSSSLSSIDLVNNLLRNEGKTYRSSPND